MHLSTPVKRTDSVAMAVPRTPRRPVRGAVALPVVVAVATFGLVSRAAAASSIPADAGSRLGVEVAVIGLLYPGVSRPVAVTISNPSSQAIRLTSLSLVVGAGTSPRGQPDPACDGPSNFVVSHQLQSSRTELRIPARATRSLTDLGIPESAWPSVAMRDLGTNQDACQGARLTLVLSAGSDRIPPS